MWYVEKVDRDMGGGLVIVREGPFEQEAKAIADAEKRGKDWRVVSSNDELETGVLV